MRLNRASALWLAPLLAAVAWCLARYSGLAAPACWTLAVTLVCALWWVLEPIPIPATSLVPFAVFPLVGVLDHKTVAKAYGHHMILLLLGGFIFSKAMEKTGTHRRLALGMVRLVGGGGGRRLVFGFMLASAVLSMWISNTATTLMLLPIATAVIEASDRKKLAVPLLLGIAYAASIGGIGTPIGTPPNLIFMQIYEKFTDKSISFSQWMTIGVPVVALMLPLAWFLLTRNLRDEGPVKIPAVGAWRPAERRVLVVFALTALAWITRAEPGGGWSVLAPGAGDSTVALMAAAVMFVIPDGTGGRLLDWESARDIPWGLLLLFGGGIAIADGFMASGLSSALGEQLSGIAGWPRLPLLLVICLVVTFLTECTSNTATTNLLMPVLASAGLAAGLDPAVLMVPAAISASCAFMLPVATAPNAIVFGSGQITIRQMVREGLWLNLVGAVLIAGICSLLL